MKVGSLEIPVEDRRQNPDTSRGLWVDADVLAKADTSRGLQVNADVLAKTRAVQNGKQKKKTNDEIKKKNTMKKNTAYAAKK